MKPVIKTVIFDLGGVLIKEARLRFGFNLNFRSIVSLFIKNGKLPTSLRPLLFKELHKLDDKQGSYYPDLFYDWLINKKTGEQVHAEFIQYLTTTKDINKSQRILLADISQVMFDSQHLASIMNVHSGAKLLKRLKKETGCKIYLISNYNSEAFDCVQARFSSMFELLDDVIVSGKVHLAKPNKSIFELSIQRWNLDVESTLYIDDEKDNVLTARQQGMYAVKYTDGLSLGNYSFHR